MMSHINEEVGSLGWYHPNLTRHVAESMLMQNGSDGAYLLRPSSRPGDLALSVRCKDSVKHFTISWQESQYHFGMATFATMSSFVDHFENQPLLAGESGVLILLKYPYPRNVEEPGNYETVRIHAELGRPPPSPNTHATFSLGSKEGYLTKQGGTVKNWKTRWFVLLKNDLKYYKDKTEKEPIRTLNLADCTVCCRDSSLGKENCFRLVFPWRTFYMYANTEEEIREWTRLIQWKMERISKDGPQQLETPRLS